MRTLADLAVESEAMMWLTMRAAHALDRSPADRAEGLLSRICTPVAKYWASKRAAVFVAEAMECHGGNGFIADHLMERLYREAPLNGIWEGSGNVICPTCCARAARAGSVAVLLAIARVAQMHASTGWPTTSPPCRPDRPRADRTRIVEMMACACGELLLRRRSGTVADAFCATRLGGDWGRAFGTLPAGLDARAIVDRARIDEA